MKATHQTPADRLRDLAADASRNFTFSEMEALDLRRIADRLEAAEAEIARLRAVEAAWVRKVGHGCANGACEACDRPAP